MFIFFDPGSFALTKFIAQGILVFLFDLRQSFHKGSEVALKVSAVDGARGRGFDTYLRRVVSLSQTYSPPKVLVRA